jgi:hypothetical protein
MGPLNGATWVMKKNPPAVLENRCCDNPCWRKFTCMHAVLRPFIG